MKGIVLLLTDMIWLLLLLTDMKGIVRLGTLASVGVGSISKSACAIGMGRDANDSLR